MDGETFGNLGHAKKRAGVVGGVHNRTPPAARRAGEMNADKLINHQITGY